MKNFVLTLLLAVGLLLIWIGGLRMMLTGLFLSIDVIGAQIWLNFNTLDERLILGLDAVGGDIAKRIDALEESVRALNRAP
jgi:hypothetical protein